MKNKKFEELITVLTNLLKGKKEAIQLTLIAFFSDGHLLIEDLPGLGKTTLALSIAKVLNLDFGRIQCTSDLLPTDIIGVKIYNKKTGEFIFYKGAIFNNIVLVDEINRTTPKTQSALLEAMEEKQITIEGETYKLPNPFFVIATQNPVEYYGTFPLPEAQLDRFSLKIKIGYPSREEEREILLGGNKRSEIENLEPILNREDIFKIKEKIKKVYISDKIVDYILDIANYTRSNEIFLSGLSVRGTLTISKLAKARAYFEGRNFVIPEDIKYLAPYSIPHRVLLKDEYEEINKEEVIKSILEEIKVPIV